MKSEINIVKTHPLVAFGARIVSGTQAALTMAGWGFTVYLA